MAHDLDRRERGWLDRRRPAVKIAAAAATAGLVALLARPITIGDVTVRLQMTAPLVSVQYARHQVIVDGSAGAAGSAPAAPTATAFTPNDSAAIFETSAYSGSAAHTSTIIHADEFEGDWSTLVYADTVDANDLTLDTTSALTADLYKARFKHVDTNGESEWSDPVQFVIPDWATNWNYATGDSTAALFDGPTGGEQNLDNCRTSCNSTTTRIAAMPNSNPHPNAFESEYDCQYGGGCGTNQGSGLLSPIDRWPKFDAVPDTMWYRWCMRINLDVFPSGAHYMHIMGADGQSGRDPFWHLFRGLTDGGDSINVSWQKNTGDVFEYLTKVPTHELLYFENEIVRFKADSARWGRIWVRDSLGVTIKNENNIVAVAPFNDTIAFTDSASVLVEADSALRRIEWGNNDPSGDWTTAESKVHYGCAAVSMQGPLGLHSPPLGG